MIDYIVYVREPHYGSDDALGLSLDADCIACGPGERIVPYLVRSPLHVLADCQLITWAGDGLQAVMSNGSCYDLDVLDGATDTRELLDCLEGVLML